MPKHLFVGQTREEGSKVWVPRWRGTLTAVWDHADEYPEDRVRVIRETDGATVGRGGVPKETQP